MRSIRLVGTAIRTRVPLLAVAAALVCACDPDEATSATCEAIGSSCSSDAGLPPELDPACNPDLSAYQLDTWREPDRPSSRKEKLTPVSSGVVTLRMLPREANAGREVITGWLTGDEPLEIDIQLALGTQENDVEAGFGALLFDGILRQRVAFPLHPGDVVPISFLLPGDEIAQGAHSAHLLFWTKRGSKLIASSLTVLKDSTTFAPRAAPVEAEIFPLATGGSDARRPGANVDLRFGGPPPEDGTLMLDIIVTPPRSDRCDSLINRYLLVAFVDNEQVPVGDLGMQPAFELRKGEAALVRAEWNDLPLPDGELHTFQLWMLGGDGRFTEAPQGQYSPWFHGPVQLARLFW